MAVWYGMLRSGGTTLQKGGADCLGALPCLILFISKRREIAEGCLEKKNADWRG